jgi:hypothetical protein
MAQHKRHQEEEKLIELDFDKDDQSNNWSYFINRSSNPRSRDAARLEDYGRIWPL